MPLETIENSPDIIWGLWKITEDERTLAAEVDPFETVPEHITNKSKRLEFISARVLVKHLLKCRDAEFRGLRKDEFGKPFLIGLDFQISLSHSYPYVAAVIHLQQAVGIDVEQPKEKLLKIAPRILHTTEQLDAGRNVVKHCIYWCAKESLVKIHGKKDLVFAENLRIDPFEQLDHGDLIGRIIVDNEETAVLLQYFVYDYFVLVVNK